MDVTFVEKQSFFSTPYLQGETNTTKDKDKDYFLLDISLLSGSSSFTSPQQSISFFVLPGSFPIALSNNQPETKLEIELEIEIPTSVHANAQPLQVYSRRRTSIPPPMQVQESNSQPSMETPLTINDLDVPITLRKGIRNCT